MSTVPDVGVWRNLLCTTNGILVDAEGKMQPPVHKMALQHGCKVPPQAARLPGGYSLSIRSCCIWLPFSSVITKRVILNFSPPALRLPMA